MKKKTIEDVVNKQNMSSSLSDKSRREINRVHAKESHRRKRERVGLQGVVKNKYKTEEEELKELNKARAVYKSTSQYNNARDRSHLKATQRRIQKEMYEASKQSNKKS